MDSEKLPPLGNALSIDHTDEMAGFGGKEVLGGEVKSEGGFDTKDVPNLPRKRQRL